MDFLPGLVAPRCKRVVLNWVNKLPVLFIFCPLFFLFYFYLLRDVETLIGTLQTFKTSDRTFITSALEFQIVSPIEIFNK